MAERRVLQGELRAVFDGEFDELNQEGEIPHGLIVIAGLLDAQAESR